jgi:small-conductance mechanosensitive channel/CRP-like cAMP-binding protein
VSYLARLLAEAVDDLTFALLASLVVVTALIQALARDERRRLRGIYVLAGLHLLLLPVLAALRGEPVSGWYNDTRLAAAIFYVLAASGLFGSLVFGILLPRIGLRAPRILRDVVAGAIGIIAIIAVANRLGFPLSGIITTSAVLTAAIGLSMQDTLGNIMGGLALQMDNSLEVGDWVKLADGTRGRVSEIRWRYTAIETRNWETVIVPNSVLMKGQVVVEGRRAGQPAQHRRWVWFNIDFRYQPSEVIGAVNEALQAAPIERVAAQPVPHCILMDLHESYGRYAVRYWLADLAVDDPTDSVVRTRIYFALKRAGIPLSIPAHAVFLTEENVERKAEKSRVDRERRLGALAQVDLFDDLDDATRGRLADRLRYAPFTRGEAMTRQGAEGHWLYMIIVGDASVRVAADGVEREVARLGAGTFFGEMSLMTGARRTATVVALTDVECYRLDKAAFQDVLQERPELAEGISAILASRKAGLIAAQEGLDHDARERRMAEEKRAILRKIRDFFGLEEGPPRAAAS